MSTNNVKHGRIVSCSKALWLFVAIISVLIFALCGCGEKARKFSSGKQTPQRGEISKEELREELDNFGEFAVSVINQAADEIDELLPGLKTQKTNLIQRARMNQAFHTMLRQKDPIIAYIETWALCVRFTQYLQEGEGRKLFGEHQDKAVIAAVQIEARIEQIGRKFSKKDIFEETRKQIYTFANKHPITGTFSDVIIYATEDKPGQKSPFADVIAIPMSPFKAMQGVDRTASAIYSVKGSIDRFTDVAQGLPESARWELLLLLLEMEETEMVKTLLASMSRLSNSSVKFVDSTEKLPERLREQISILVDEIDSKQANIQTTLDKGEKTAVAVDKVFSTAGQTIEITGGVAKNVNEAAKEWKTAADSTTELIQVIRQWLDETPKKEPSSKNTVSDYKDTAQGVTDAANELRALVTDVRGLLESETLSSHIEDVNNTVVGALDQSAVNAQSVTDHITWRLIQLAGVIFVMALLYRFIVGYLRVKPR